MTNIDKDAYLILVYKDFNDIIVSDYSEKDVENTTNTLNSATNIAKTDTGSKWIKLLNAGITSDIGQNMMSKVGLPNSVKGRIQSSIYDIIADGKISNTEVAEDFISSCTNELDSTAINLGFPTPSGLYQAIMPNGSGIISQDFINFFQKNAKKDEEVRVEQRNNVAQDLSVLKFRLITDDNESWSMELPTRRTQKGFDIVESILLSNMTRDFEISIVKNDNKGVTDIHAIKAQLEDIKDKKVPFDIYVNDPYNKKQLVWKHCFFSSVNWKPEGTNCLNASVSITKIPEWEVKTEQVSGNTSKRIQGKVTSSKVKSNKVKPKSKTSKFTPNAGTTDITSWIKDNMAKERFGSNPARILTNKDGTANYANINNYLKTNGCKGTAEDYGIK